MFTPSNEMFANKQNQTMNFKLRRNPASSADAKNPFLYETIIKNGADKGKKLRYYVLDLIPLAKYAADGRKMFFNTAKDNIAYSVTEFKKGMYATIVDALKESIESNYTAGLFDKTGLAAEPIDACMHTYPTGFEYKTRTKDGRELTMSQIKFVTVMEEVEEASKIYAAMLKNALKTRIVTASENNAAITAQVNSEIEAPVLDTPEDDGF